MKILLPILALVVVAPGCKRSAPPAPPDLLDPRLQELPPGLLAGLPSRGGDDEVRAVYPAAGVTPDPQARRYCEAIHSRPEERRAACCNGAPGLVFADDCTRTLSAAIQAKALRLDEAALGRCLAEWEAALAGCDWVGIFLPPLPAACAEALTGLLAAGARCRSSIECQGPLRCHGAGPTAGGRCAPPLADGTACGLAVDQLAVFARVDEVDRLHPECHGACRRHVCAPRPALGAPCTTSAECGPDRHCGDARCAEGPVGKLGSPCVGAGCAPGLRCVDRRCAVPKPTGAPCGSEFECRGGCLKPDGGGEGRCGPRCGVR